MNVRNMWMILAMTLAVLVSANAQAQSQMRTGPANYHQVYGNIQNTVITIQDFFLRTNDGKVLKIATQPMNVDLQDLTARGRGLLVDTRNAAFPQDAQTIDVVEIETRIVAGTSYINSADGSQCKLSAMPKYLNLYTKTATSPTGVQMLKDEYLVKVDYSALNAIQLDVVTQGTQNGEVCDCFDKVFGGGSSGRSCNRKAKITYRSVLKCELVNRRHPIADIVRKVDEF